MKNATCLRCHINLNNTSSVLREYINKNPNKPSVFGLGHYELNGDYEPDNKTVFDSSDSYDLLDDSDKCAVCDYQL